MADTSSLILIGRVFKAHGVQGEVKVIPESDDPERLRSLKQVYVGKSVQTARPVAVRSIRTQMGAQGVTLVFALGDIEDRDQAERLRGSSVYAEATALPALEEDEVFIHDLIGLEVVSTEGQVIGRVKDVLEMPAHLVYVVESAGAADIMIPAVPEFIDRIDLEGGRIIVRLIEGLIE